MTSRELFLLKILVGACSALFGIASAACALAASARTRQQQIFLRLWFRHKWLIINKTRYRELLLVVLRWMMNVRTRGLRTLLSPWWLSKRAEDLTILPMGAINLLLVFVWFPHETRVDYQLTRTDWLLSSLLVAMVVTFAIIAGVQASRSAVRAGILALASIVMMFAVLAAVCGALSFSLVGMIGLMLVMVPWGLYLYYRVIYMCLDVTRFERVAPLLLFVIAIHISLLYTSLLLAVGHYVVPHATVPKTLQMLVANVAFDAITVLATFALFRRAVAGSKSLLFVVVVNAVIAASAASSSLWLGTITTDHAVGLLGSFRVLIGLAPDQPSRQLGPMFWAMHTTFLPLLILFAFLFVSWLGKLLLSPIAWFFSKAQHDEIDALNLTARFLALLAAVLAAGYYVVTVLEQSIFSPASP